MTNQADCLCGKKLPRKAKNLLFICVCGITWVSAEKLILLLVNRNLLSAIAKGN